MLYQQPQKYLEQYNMFVKNVASLDSKIQYLKNILSKSDDVVGFLWAEKELAELLNMKNLSNQPLKHKPEKEEGLTNVISTIKVYESYDYEKFKFVFANREIDNNHVKKIIKSMQKELVDAPIIVNSQMEIIDGQHRFYAFQALKLPVRYIVKDNYTHKDIIAMNTNTKSWSGMNLINSFAMKGNQNALIYVDLMKKYKDFSISLICKSFGCHDTKKYAELYILGSSSPDAKRAENSLYKLSMYKGVLPYYNHVYAARVLMDLGNKKGFDNNRLIKKIQTHGVPTFYNLRREMIREFERIYNYRSTLKVKFLDENGRVKVNL